MLEAMLSGLASFTPSLMLFLVLGVLVGQVMAVIPGLGGIVGMVLLLPFSYAMEPLAAIAMMIAIAATVGTGNTITSVLFGVPGSPTGVAIVFDGYPMAKRGEAGRAIGAGLTASAVGGVFGALVLAVMIPLIRPIVQQTGPAEFLALVVVALLLVAKIGEGDTYKALIAGGIGLMLTFVGQEPSTGTLRYTFGALYLWDGVPLVPTVIGLYAIAEMITLVRSGKPIASEASERAIDGRRHGVLQGVRDVFHHRWIALVSSGIGSAVGILPGMGGVASQFIAYAQAERMSRDPSRFRHGAVEGVIGPDASTNATEAGALVPALAFGIPGNATVAVLLGVFIIHGVQPGAGMLTDGLHIVWFIIFVLVLANVIAAGFCLSFAGTLARITNVRVSIIVPSVLAVSFFGAYLQSERVADIGVALAFGFVGYAMQQHRYSRATLVIGLVLGGILEHNFMLATQLYGWRTLTRPVFLAIVLLAVVLGVLSAGVSRRKDRRTSSDTEVRPRKATPPDTM